MSPAKAAAAVDTPQADVADCDSTDPGKSAPAPVAAGFGHTTAHVSSTHQTRGHDTAAKTAAKTATVADLGLSADDLVPNTSDQGLAVELESASAAAEDPAAEPQQQQHGDGDGPDAAAAAAAKAAQPAAAAAPRVDVYAAAASAFPHHATAAPQLHKDNAVVAPAGADAVAAAADGQVADAGNKAHSSNGDQAAATAAGAAATEAAQTHTGAVAQVGPALTASGSRGHPQAAAAAAVSADVVIGSSRGHGPGGNLPAKSRRKQLAPRPSLQWLRKQQQKQQQQQHDDGQEGPALQQQQQQQGQQQQWEQEIVEPTEQLTEQHLDLDQQQQQQQLQYDLPPADDHIAAAAANAAAAEPPKVAAAAAAGHMHPPRRSAALRAEENTRKQLNKPPAAKDPAALAAAAAAAAASERIGQAYLTTIKARVGIWDSRRLFNQAGFKPIKPHDAMRENGDVLDKTKVLNTGRLIAKIRYEFDQDPSTSEIYNEVEEGGRWDVEKDNQEPHAPLSKLLDCKCMINQPLVYCCEPASYRSKPINDADLLSPCCRATIVPTPAKNDVGNVLKCLNPECKKMPHWQRWTYEERHLHLQELRKSGLYDSRKHWVLPDLGISLEMLGVAVGAGYLNTNLCIFCQKDATALEPDVYEAAAAAAAGGDLDRDHGPMFNGVDLEGGSATDSLKPCSTCPMSCHKACYKAFTGDCSIPDDNTPEDDGVWQCLSCREGAACAAAGCEYCAEVKPHTLNGEYMVEQYELIERDVAAAANPAAAAAGEANQAAAADPSAGRKRARKRKQQQQQQQQSARKRARADGRSEQQQQQRRQREKCKKRCRRDRRQRAEVGSEAGSGSSSSSSESDIDSSDSEERQHQRAFAHHLVSLHSACREVHSARVEVVPEDFWKPKPLAAKRIASPDKQAVAAAGQAGQSGADKQAGIAGGGPDRQAAADQAAAGPDKQAAVAAVAAVFANAGANQQLPPAAVDHGKAAGPLADCAGSSSGTTAAAAGSPGSIWPPAAAAAAAAMEAAVAPAQGEFSTGHLKHAGLKGPDAAAAAAGVVPVAAAAGNAVPIAAAAGASATAAPAASGCRAEVLQKLSDIFTKAHELVDQIQDPSEVVDSTADDVRNKLYDLHDSMSTATADEQGFWISGCGRFFQNAHRSLQAMQQKYSDELQEQDDFKHWKAAVIKRIQGMPA